MMDLFLFSFRRSPFDVHKFEKFLTEQMPQNVFRAKASYGFNDSDATYFNSALRLRCGTWFQSTQNQLVFIGLGYYPINSS